MATPKKPQMKRVYCPDCKQEIILRNLRQCGVKCPSCGRQWKTNRTGAKGPSA